MAEKELKPSDPKGPMTQRIDPSEFDSPDQVGPALGRTARDVGGAPADIQVRDRKFDDATVLELDPATMDPNRHYRWVRLDGNAKSVAKAKRRGYTVERHKQGGVRTLADPDSRADSAIAIGDLILMSCPKALAEERIESRRRRTENLLASTSALTEEAAREKGITMIKDPDHGRVTKEIR